jgi:antitoxin CcdA
MSNPAISPSATTTLVVEEALLAEARALDIDATHAAEAGIARAIATKHGELWLAANREALESSNAYVERHGLPLARHRNF